MLRRLYVPSSPLAVGQQPSVAPPTAIVAPKSPWPAIATVMLVAVGVWWAREDRRKALEKAGLA